MLSVVMLSVVAPIQHNDIQHKGLICDTQHVTHSIINTQHNNALPCAECLYAKCRILFTIMLNVVMLCCGAFETVSFAGGDVT